MNKNLNTILIIILSIALVGVVLAIFGKAYSDGVKKGEENIASCKDVLSQNRDKYESIIQTCQADLNLLTQNRQ